MEKDADAHGPPLNLEINKSDRISDIILLVALHYHWSRTKKESNGIAEGRR